MDWHDYISSDPEILGGKPAVRGTRLSVEFLLGLLAEGWSQEEMLSEYPRLKAVSLQAVFAYAAEILGEEALYAIRPSA